MKHMTLRGNLHAAVMLGWTMAAASAWAATPQAADGAGMFDTYGSWTSAFGGMTTSMLLVIIAAGALTWVVTQIRT